jgi:hypothetical protein
LVEARVQTVQDAQPHRKDVKARDAAECRRWLRELVVGKHERTRRRYPATPAGRGKPRQVRRDRGTKKNAAYYRCATIAEECVARHQ